MSVEVNVTEEYITFEIINDGEDDLKRFYTPAYFEHLQLMEYVEIYVQRTGTSRKSQKGGYFQDMSKLTIPYRYFAYVLDNDLVSDTIKQNDVPRTQYGTPSYPWKVKTAPHLVPSFLSQPPLLKLDRKEEIIGLTIKGTTIKGPMKALIEGKEKVPRESLASTNLKPRESLASTNLEPRESLASTNQTEEEPEYEIIVLKCKRNYQEGNDGWLREVQDLENIDKDIELTTDGLYYDDLDQIYRLSQWLNTVPNDVGRSPESFVNSPPASAHIPVCTEELYRINGRWLFIKSNSKAGERTSIDTLDKKNLPFPTKTN